MLHVLGACSAVPFAGLFHSCHFGSRSFTFHPNFNPIIVPPAVTEQGVPSGEWVSAGLGGTSSRQCHPCPACARRARGSGVFAGVIYKRSMAVAKEKGLGWSSGV